MRNYVSQSVQNMRPSGIRRYFDIAATMKDVITLGIGEPNFTTPQHIMDKGIESLERGQTGYTSNAGMLNCARRFRATCSGCMICTMRRTIKCW